MNIEKVNTVIADLNKLIASELDALRIIAYSRMRDDLMAATGQDSHLDANELYLVRQGAWIQAIKSLRNRRGITLAEAKETVEAEMKKMGIPK